MPRKVAVVPHTHWDREWYAPFQAFRARLVDLLDDLLDRLERDPAYTHFMLDGQMAVVDDYLEVRPEAEARIRHLAATGRVGVGPWYALMDEFLVSGETIVRNLAKGIDRAAAFGGAMQIGYLPDMFGHIAQMPQLLTQFGFEHAVVWRGVPSAIDRSAFWWRAPDGSTLRAEYLPKGYGNGAALPDDAADLVARIREFHEEHAPLIAEGPILWMNGTDHLVPFATLPAVLAAANDRQTTYELAITPLAAYLAEAPSDGLSVWEGELRSGARANLLMGVASNRSDVRQAQARAESGLERLAEPLAAMSPGPWPTELLEIAWRKVILNSAHDSVCACSVDEVCDAVLVRYSEASAIAAALVGKAISAIGRGLAEPEAVVVNTSARARGGLVELELPGNGGGDGLQLQAESPTVVHAHRVDAAEAAVVVERELGLHLGVQAVEIVDASDTSVEVHIHVEPANRRVPALGWVSDRLRELAASRPGTTVDVWLHRPPRRRVLARVEAVPGLGWRPWRPEPLTHAPATAAADGLTLGNGLVQVSVDPDDGTFSVNGHTGLGRLVDDGDEGDTYNYSPPAEQRVVDTPEEVSVETIEAGPLRSRVAINACYRWPERIEAGRRVGGRSVAVTTTLELRAGERILRGSTRLENHCRDHRLRVHFPLPAPAAYSDAECAFAIVRRGLVAEGGVTEHGLATFPSRRFVQAGGLTFLHEGLPEYELVDLDGDRARELAVTLLRCTGWLSRGPMAYRPLPAGPEIQVEGAQMQGPQELRWALHLDEGPEPADPYALAEDAFVPLLVARGDGGGALPSNWSLVDLRGAVVSAVLAAGSDLVLRVFNPRPEPTTVEVPGRSGWLLDLAGRPVERFAESLPLAAFRIATLKLDPVNSR